MEKVLDKLVDLVFKNRWLVAVIASFALAYWLHKDESTWKDTELYASTAFNRVQDRPTVWVGVGLAIAGYVFWIVLVHISHRHWREEGATHYEPREWVSRGNSCNVILVEKWSDKDRGWVQQVQVENTSGQSLDHVVGRFRIITHDIRTREIPFAVNHLEPKGRAVASDLVSSDGLFSGYDVFLEEVTTPLASTKNFTQFGGHIGHNFTRLFNTRLRRAFWPRRQLYDIKWLEDAIRWTLWMRVRRIAFPKTYRVANGRRVRTPAEILHSITGCVAIALLACLVFALIGTAFYGVTFIAWNIGDAVYRIAFNKIRRTFS